MEEQLNDKATYLNILGFIFSKPRIAFKLILEKDETMPQLFILGIFGFLTTIIPIIVFETYIELPLFKIIFKGLIGAAFNWIGIWFLSHLINFTNHILKTETEFEDVYYIFSYSFCPLIVTFLVTFILHMLFHSVQIIHPLLAFLTFIGYIWTFSLLFIGNKLLTKANWIKNIISVFVPLTILIILNLLVISLRS
jgi:hypothetical protein